MAKPKFDLKAMKSGKGSSAKPGKGKPNPFAGKAAKKDAASRGSARGR